MPYNAANALAFCQSKSGRYRDGECWTLIEDAVVGNGGVSSKILTPNFGPNADYVWGAAVQLGQLRAGDILQFRNYSWRSVTETRVTDGQGGWNTNTQTQSQTRSHHTAMVVRLIAVGEVEVIEQNIPANTGPVQTVTLRLASAAAATTTTPNPGGGDTSVTVTHNVTNPPRAYRPA